MIDTLILLLIVITLFIFYKNNNSVNNKITNYLYNKKNVNNDTDTIPTISHNNPNEMNNSSISNNKPEKCNVDNSTDDDIPITNNQDKFHDNKLNAFNWINDKLKNLKGISTNRRKDMNPNKKKIILNYNTNNLNRHNIIIPNKKINIVYNPLDYS